MKKNALSWIIEHKDVNENLVMKFENEKFNFSWKQIPHHKNL